MHMAVSNIQILREDTSKQNDKGNQGKMAKLLYAFRADGATTDLIFGRRLPIEKNREYGKELLMAFIDYKRAFDSVKREEIWKSVEKQALQQTF
jgi:hypothetical protein